MNKKPTDATVCRYLFTAKLLYMFRVPQHPSSGTLKTVTAASCTGHNTGAATSLQRGPIGRFSVFTTCFDLLGHLQVKHLCTEYVLLLLHIECQATSAPLCTLKTHFLKSYNFQYN